MRLKVLSPSLLALALAASSAPAAVARARDAGAVAPLALDAGPGTASADPGDEDDAGEEPPITPDAGVIDFFPDGGVRPLGPTWLHFTGNRVLPAEVYKVQLALPRDAQPSEALAHQIERSVYRFLKRSGYDLATVTATFADQQINVQVDEGRLEKVVFRGGLTVQSLQFKLALFIDQDVFNRYTLQRQVDRLSKSIGIKVVKWALVPTANPDHIGFQLTNLPALEGFELVHEREPYELHFFFEEHDWNVGLGADLRSSYLDGLEVGINYQNRNLLFDGDRWRVAASGGAGIRKRIYDSTYYPDFSRAFVEARYYTPPLAGIVQPYVWLTGTLIGRNRPDLLVENYNEASSIFSGHVKVHITEGFSASIGLGGEWRRIFHLVPSSALMADQQLPPDVDDLCPPAHRNGCPGSERLRAFTELRAEWVIKANEERPDRRHALQAGVRYYFGTAPGSSTSDYKQYGWLYEDYQKVFDFGWNDLWLKSHARATWGDVVFHDERPLAEYLRGILGGIWVRKAANFSAEYRFSVTRDVIKLSLFVEAAVWGQTNRCFPSSTNPAPCGPLAPSELIDPPESLRFGVTGGPGIHVLMQGMFQLDIYGSFGLASPTFDRLLGSKFDFGALAILNKVF